MTIPESQLGYAPDFWLKRYNHFGAAVREDVPKAPFATAKEGGLAAEALGVADATHGAHGEPEDSMLDRELLELPTSATERVEAPRHQVRSKKTNERLGLGCWARSRVPKTSSRP